MDRRGFFGWVCGGILGLLGVGRGGRAIAPLRKRKTVRCMGEVVTEAARRIVRGYRKEFPQLESPNAYHSWLFFEGQVTAQLLFTGRVLVWLVPNMLGGLHELVVLPTNFAVPQSATELYPGGYYRVERHPLGLDVMFPVNVPAEQVDVYKL